MCQRQHSLRFPYGNLQSPNCIGPECPIVISAIAISSTSDTTPEITIKAIVDSSAVKTTVPEEKIRNLDTVRGEPVELKNGDGTTTLANTYFIKFKIGTETLTRRIIALPNQKYAKIGRDILNKYKIEMDAVNMDAVNNPAPEWRIIVA